MLSAKFFGSSTSNSMSAYNKNFVQAGLSNTNNSPWILQITANGIIITTATPYPITITSDLTTGNLTVNGTSVFDGNCTINGNLTVNGSITTVSDRLQKKNIINIKDNEINLLKELVPVEYEYKHSFDKHYGFIAQEVQNIYPHLVINTDGIKTINYIELIPLLVGKINNIEKKLFINKLLFGGIVLLTCFNTFSSFLNNPNK